MQRFLYGDPPSWGSFLGIPNLEGFKIRDRPVVPRRKYPKMTPKIRKKISQFVIFLLPTNWPTSVCMVFVEGGHGGGDSDVDDGSFYQSSRLFRFKCIVPRSACNFFSDKKSFHRKCFSCCHNAVVSFFSFFHFFCTCLQMHRRQLKSVNHRKDFSSCWHALFLCHGYVYRID